MIVTTLSIGLSYQVSHKLGDYCLKMYKCSKFGVNEALINICYFLGGGYSGGRGGGRGRGGGGRGGRGGGGRGGSKGSGYWTNPQAEPFRKLFVGGLSYETTDDGLKEHFEKYGEIVDHIVMKDPQSKR